MILSAAEITRRLDLEIAQENWLSLPMGECQQPASYDLRAADALLLPRGTCTLVPVLNGLNSP